VPAFKGSLRDFRLYGRCLSQAEITKLVRDTGLTAR
jgi:hypothetical protein